MTRSASKFAIAAATAILAIAAANAAQAQGGGFQWNPSQATSSDVTPSQVSEPVNGTSAQALYQTQTGATRTDAKVTQDPGEIFAGYVGAYSL